MKRLFLFLMLIAAGSLVACNTWDGLGKDVERGGEKMQKQSDDKKK